MPEIKVERLRRIEDKGNLKAFVDMSFDSGFIVKGFFVLLKAKRVYS